MVPPERASGAIGKINRLPAPDHPVALTPVTAVARP
jgi:hypothetical protein